MRQKLADFLPNWDPDSEQTSVFNKRKRKPSIDSPPNLRSLWRWTLRHTSDGNGPLIQHSFRFQDLFEHLLDVEDESSWYFNRPMGKGSFGAAALFDKIGENGKIADDVVVKSANAKPKHMLGRGGLVKEAAIVSQLYALDNNFLLTLRHYTWHRTQPQCRFYLEHYEYGDLHRLHLR